MTTCKTTASFSPSGKGYVDAGFSPVKLSPKAVAMVDLMLLEDNADFKFQTWAALKNSDPVISNFISVGSSDAEAKAHYDNVRQTMPRSPCLSPQSGYRDEGHSTPEQDALGLFQRNSLG